MIDRRLSQSRAAIGNLAHALKTPLAVLFRIAKNPAKQDQPELKNLLQAQTATMRKRIDHELKRARLSGHIQSGASFNPYLELSALAELLINIYSEKQLAITIQAPNHPIPFDREDLLELIGNLADNACKWGKSQAYITVINRHKLTLSVADDGSGCPEHELEQLTQRGMRLDESMNSNGLGLAIDKDIAEFYGGSLELASSPDLGGLLVTVRF